MMGMLNLFSGGAMMQCAIGTLGIMPYISASIIIQLMTAVVPQLEKLAGSLEPAARSAKAGKNKEAAFYEGVLQSAKYFINAVLPGTMGQMKAIEASDASTIEIPEAAFGG